MNRVRTRMAPSPTGELHIGSMAMVLKNYAYAKKMNGDFVLRIEDTDKVREVEGGVDDIIDIIKLYGLDWDEGPGKDGEFGPYIQSKRLHLYAQKAQELIDADKAYLCFCSKERLEKVRDQQRAAKTAPKYDKHCRNLSESKVTEKLASNQPHVIRLKVPEDQHITFTDLLRGDITFHSSEVDDQVLIKSDGYPTYHMAVVVDDYMMKISHIMRGEEWISSTPKHVLLYKAFGWEQPIYAHIPVFLNPDGKGKMSKRKGTVSSRSFLERGYLPEALLNFFMILGWAHPEEKEVLTLDEYVEHFDPKDVSSKSVVFDIAKLNWLNGVYIRKLALNELREKVDPFLPNDFPVEKSDQILPLIHERLVTLTEVEELTSFFYRDISVDRELLSKKTDKKHAKTHLLKTAELLSGLDEWSVENIEKAIRNLQESEVWHRGKYFMLLRLAATGSKATPPLFDTLFVLEKNCVVERLRKTAELF